MLAVCLLSWAALQTPTPAERLARAEHAQAELEYAAAAEELMAIIADGRATDDELFQANLRAGVLQRIMGNDVEARLHFLYVLKRQPDHQLAGDLPPKVTVFFDLVRQELHQTTSTPGVSATTLTPTPMATPGVSSSGSAARSEPPAVEDNLLLTVVPWGALALSLGLAVMGVGAVLVGTSPLLLFLFSQSQLSALERGDPSGLARDEAASLWEAHHSARLAWEGWGVWLTAAGVAGAVVMAAAAAASAGVGAMGLASE